MLRLLQSGNKSCSYLWTYHGVNRDLWYWFLKTQQLGLSSLRSWVSGGSYCDCNPFQHLRALHFLTKVFHEIPILQNYNDKVLNHYIISFGGNGVRCLHQVTVCRLYVHMCKDQLGF